MSNQGARRDYCRGRVRGLDKVGVGNGRKMNVLVYGFAVVEELIKSPIFGKKEREAMASSLGQLETI